jgi:hypothetical protein
VQFTAKGALTRGTLYDDPDRIGEWREIGHVAAIWWRPGIDLLAAFQGPAGALGIDLRRPYTRLTRLTFDFEANGRKFSARSPQLTLDAHYARLSGTVGDQPARIWVRLDSLLTPQEIADGQ